MSDLEEERAARFKIRIGKKMEQYSHMKFSDETMGRIEHELMRELTIDFEKREKEDDDEEYRRLLDAYYSDRGILDD